MDDINYDANIESFLIGPTSIVGRTIAFKILFCKSMSHFRDQLVGALIGYMRWFKSYVGPVLSWFDPRHPQGILAMVTIIGFLLNRYTDVKRRAQVAYRRKLWRNMMRVSPNYEKWLYAANKLDKESPIMNESMFYDEELVKNKLQELWQRRQQGSLRDIMFCMRADLIRNLGNMCNPQLHKGRLQVPKLIREYINEVRTQLKLVCDSDSEELSLEEKLSFMHEIRHAFGRTALLLSGGASLGTFHVGVIKTLVEHKLLPRIIAGSSVGSIMCAIVATRSWPELQSFFEHTWHSLKFFDQMGGILAIIKRVTTHGAVHEIRQLQVMLRDLTNNMTFQEAYDMTGRILGITVCSPRKHEPPRCLNYLTSPHVVIWSAVTASCAFPGLFEAQELMAKNRFDELVPYHPPFHLGPEEGTIPARRWRDGSLESDLPMAQLKELFNVNHFIVSQANPHIAPLLRLKEFVRSYGGNFAAKLAQLAEMEVKHRCNQILELGFPLGEIAKLFAQAWEGDVTVVMPATLAQYSKMIQNPSYAELQKAANQGRRCTWEKLSAIKSNCGIELALDECVTNLNHMRRLKRSAQKAQNPSSTKRKFSAARRIPSWISIARENSTGSLEDEVLADVSAFQQDSGTSTTAGTSRQHRRTGKNYMQDFSDSSESDSADLHSWTRSGGPLMRSISAEEFVKLVHKRDSVSRDSRDENLKKNLCEQRDTGSRSSITVSEGDLLQTERIGNGIVLNIVKMEELTVSGQNIDTGSCSGMPSPCPETVQLESLERDMDVSSESECDDDEKQIREVEAISQTTVTKLCTIDHGNDTITCETNCPMSVHIR